MTLNKNEPDEATSASQVDRRQLLQRTGAIGLGAVAIGSAHRPVGATGETAVTQAADGTPAAGGEDPKEQALDADRVDPGTDLTDNMGHAVSDDQNSLRAGTRGPTLLDDFHFREKISHFDHERIPERVVHARGAAAHGYFQVYESMAPSTMANVLQDPAKQTPVFVRFSTVAGSRGSADTARDVRGFAVRFYTDDGNWDIVGNNIPIFFIQDAIKFPDLIHAVKPEPDREIPQASSAHDTFYDFISLTPESIPMIMWVMSDRAIPRSFSTMQGFGVHTFRFVNDRGVSRFVKFHWKPMAGVHALVWDEAQKLAGRDADFHRRGLWDAIEAGNFPEWELGIQMIDEGEDAAWDFDILDATKIWPEDLVPVQPVGRMVLNRNPDNYFSETEQVAFMTTNIVPGIDFSDDPLLQGRNFSYLDTQLSRLGSPNWPQIPINRPINAVSNYQRDGHMRTTIETGRVSYEPNSLGGNKPAEVTADRGGFVSYPAPVSGVKQRVRSETFGDHYGQASLFWNSISPAERLHIVRAQQFELAKVETRDIRLRMINHLRKINDVLGEQVASALGETDAPGQAPTDAQLLEMLANATTPTTASAGLRRTSGLSIEEYSGPAKGRKVAMLVGDGLDTADALRVSDALTAEGVTVDLIAARLGDLHGDGEQLTATRTFLSTPSVVYDAVYVPAGAGSADALANQAAATLFVEEAYKHGKPVAASGEGLALLQRAKVPVSTEQGVFDLSDAEPPAFVTAVAAHRFSNRPDDMVPV